MNYIRISHIKQYPLYNEKNRTDDKNINEGEFSRHPTMDRVEMQLSWSGHFFLFLDLKRENPGKYSLSEIEQEQGYEGNEYFVTLDWYEWDSWLIGITGKMDYEKRYRKVGDSVLDTSNQEQDLILQWVDVYLGYRISPGDFVTVGIVDSRFENKINSSFQEEKYHFILKTRQIYGFWEHSPNQWIQWIFSLQGGDVNLFKYKGEEDTDAEERRSNDYKGGIALAFVNELSYRLMINTTWDLDLIDQKQWDGGNVQLQVYF